MARYLAFLALAPLVTGAAIPSCAVEGKGYNDPSSNTTANGVPADSAAACQEECKGTVVCAVWTWYKDKGACWLQGDSAQLTVISEDAISGPVRCAGDITAATTGTAGALNKATGASLPWYAWLFIALLVAAIGLCCLMCICCSQKKAKKTSRGSKVAKEEPTTDSQPLMGTEAQLEAQTSQAAPMAMMAAPMMVPQYYQAAAPMMAPQPVTYSVAQPAAYAMQPATYSVAQPATYSVAQPATYSVAQPVMMVQAEPAAYMS